MMLALSNNPGSERAWEMIYNADGNCDEFPMLSFDDVKEKAYGKWGEIFELFFPGITRSDPYSKYSTCPMCGKKWKFCFFDDFEETGVCICYSCHPNGGDGITTIAWLLDCAPNEARWLLSSLLQTDLLQ